MHSTPRPPLVLSTEVYKYWVIDRPRRRRGVVLQSGEQHWETIPDDDGILDSQLSTTIFDWEKWWVINTTNRGDMVLAEAYSPLPGDPTKGCPIVYLDQGHWSTVAQVIVNPDLVRQQHL